MLAQFSPLSYEQVKQISINESENILVSCGDDNQILIWRKGKNQKWEFNYAIKTSVKDYGNRVCLINDQMIAWQQYSQGYTHIFKMEYGRFIEKPEFKIELKQVKDEGTNLFPCVFNKQKQILLQKHNKYVYIIRQQQNGKFEIECDPIDCNSEYNYGALTNDGQYLIIWDYCKREFRVYKLLIE